MSGNVMLCFRFAIILPVLAFAWHFYQKYKRDQLDKWAAGVYRTIQIHTYFPDTYTEGAPNGSYKEFYNSLYTEGEAYHPMNDHSNEGHYHDHRTLDYGHQEEVVAALNEIRHKGNDAITDVVEFGCSHGWGLAQLVGHGYKAWGMDVAEKAIQLATAVRGRTCGEGSEPCFWQASLTNLPFKDGQFDAGISSDVLEHLMPEDVPRAVSEMSRVVKRHMVHSIASMGGGSMHPSAIKSAQGGHVTLEWWREQFTAAGWNIVRESWGGVYCSASKTTPRVLSVLGYQWMTAGILFWPTEWPAIPLPIKITPFSLKDLCEHDVRFEMVRAT